jgi:hypothetical protein
MKNILLLSTVCMAFAGSGLSLLHAADGPKMEFESTTYDFGKIKQGEVAKHSYVFTNTGNATLEILLVKPGCGCTTAGDWDKKVEPGKTGSIPLQFNSTGFGGTVSKSATVTCNDPARSNVVLVLSGTVWRPVDITPGMAMFQIDSDSQTNQTKVLKIVSNMEEPLTVTEVTNSNKSFTTEVKTVKEGKEYELHVTAVPPFSQPTTFSQITVRTSATNVPPLNVTAYATLQMQVTVSPMQINLPAGPLTNAVTQTVTVYYRGTNAFSLSEPKVSYSGAEVTIKEVQPGKVFSVLTTFPVGTQIKSGEAVQVTVKTDHSKQPLLTVPVFQMQQPPAATHAAAPAAPVKVGSEQRTVPLRAAAAPAAPTPPAGQATK